VSGQMGRWYGSAATKSVMEALLNVQWRVQYIFFSFRVYTYPAPDVPEV
jgi:hypothetical protein